MASFSGRLDYGRYAGTQRYAGTFAYLGMAQRSGTHLGGSLTLVRDPAAYQLMRVDFVGKK